MSTTETQTPELTKVVTVSLQSSEAIAVLGNTSLFTGAADPTRPLLRHALVTCSGLSAQIVATDSYALIRQDMVVNAEDSCEGTFLLDHGLMVEAVKVAKKKENAGLPVVITADSVRVTITVGGWSLSERTYEGDFPNWQQLWPDDATLTGLPSIGIGTWQLARLAKVVNPDAVRSAPRKGRVTYGGEDLTKGLFRFQPDDRKPFLVEYGTRTTVLVMPTK